MQRLVDWYGHVLVQRHLDWALDVSVLSDRDSVGSETFISVVLQLERSLASVTTEVAVTTKVTSVAAHITTVTAQLSTVTAQITKVLVSQVMSCLKVRVTAKSALMTSESSLVTTEALLLLSVASKRLTEVMTLSASLSQG